MISPVAATLLVASMRLVASHAVYPDGAPPGFSGGFKEDNCSACHFYEPLNAPPGTLTLAGAPERFTPGERYTLTITLTRVDMKFAGFQLAVRFKDTAARAGTLAVPATETERIKVEDSSGIQYASQKRPGSILREAGIARGVIEWTAPSSGGAVIFNVAANAANGDERVDGDFVYTASVESPPGR